jgi:hypothetical protein
LTVLDEILLGLFPVDVGEFGGYVFGDNYNQGEGEG